MIVYRYKSETGRALIFSVDKTSAGTVVTIKPTTKTGEAVIVPAPDFNDFVRGIDTVHRHVEKQFGRDKRRNAEFKVLDKIRIGGTVHGPGEMVLLPLDSSTHALCAEKSLEPVDPRCWLRYLSPNVR